MPLCVCNSDAGDSGFGFATNSLELGCDCVGHIHYFDAMLSNVKGAPRPLHADTIRMGLRGCGSQILSQWHVTSCKGHISAVVPVTRDGSLGLGTLPP